MGTAQINMVRPLTSMHLNEKPVLHDKTEDNVWYAAHRMMNYFEETNKGYLSDFTVASHQVFHAQCSVQEQDVGLMGPSDSGVEVSNFSQVNM